MRGQGAPIALLPDRTGDNTVPIWGCYHCECQSVAGLVTVWEAVKAGALSAIDPPALVAEAIIVMESS